MPSRITIAVAAVATAATGCGAAAALVAGGERLTGRAPVLELLVILAVGWSFAGCGLAGWARRPASRTGPLMMLAGAVWFLRTAAAFPGPAPQAIGRLAGLLFAGVLVVLVAGYPGRQAFTHRWPASALRRHAQAPLAPLGQASAAPRSPQAPFAHRWRDSALWRGPQTSLARLWRASPLRRVAQASARRWRAGAPRRGPQAPLTSRWRASALRRRAQAPALLGGAAVLGAVGVRQLGDLLDWPRAVTLPLGWLPDLALVLWPPVLLLGLLRDRLDRAAIGELVLTLSRDSPGPGRVREALARALRDGSLEVAFPLPGGGQVDAAGQTVQLTEAAGRAVTVLERDGEPIAALRYDATADPGLVREAAAAAGLALQNERLRAEALARLDEVRQSRARILAASDAARRSVERDLHDGAQQRLIGVALAVRLLRDRVDGPAAQELAVIADELDAAVRELRELARGLHPTVLSDGGLGPALTSLAERSSVPVALAAVPARRLSEAIEVACYFVVAEALTNAAKHAGAQLVRVTVELAGGSVRVEVTDDGHGGADPTGSGLRGLADRVTALGGRFDVASAAGGTRISAELPCE
ncbi:histidine kinase [Actinoplanes sp. NPDC024001]|uniref:sensor histidine kinase n=1 Tax=Actinoplanes sp. NPDC024001 TaxID=3154598 RepID=UPI0033CBF860